MNKYECCDDVCGKDIRISFCPKCKSKSVGYIFKLGNLFGIIPKMKCKDCGFNAPSFPILIANEKELKKAIGDIRKRNEGKIKKGNKKITRRKSK